MTCLSHNTIVDLVEQRLDDGRRREVFAHIDGCSGCRALVAASTEAIAPPPASTRSDDEETVIGFEVPLLSEGAVVDHYHVIRRLGRGGMGEVYLAYDPQLDRKVALKMVKPELLRRGRARERFIKEARATARLNHPNIVTIHGVGEHLGQPYVALELLEGRTLSERMSYGRMPIDEIVQVGAEIAGALAAAHDAGVFHRDLKPTNIMLCLDGRARVLDFGLAEFAEPDPWTAAELDHGSPASHSSTRVGGTPSYMAPEQWAAAPPSGATDVWALGVILYEMCAGHRPFTTQADDTTRAQLRQLRDAVCAKQPVPLAAVRAAGAPPALVEIVSRSLDKEPSLRITATEVAAAMLPLHIEHTISSMSVDAIVATRPPPPRPNRLPYVLGAALSLVTAGAGIFAVTTLQRPAALARPAFGPVVRIDPSSPRSSEHGAPAEAETEAEAEAEPSPSTNEDAPAIAGPSVPDAPRPESDDPEPETKDGSGEPRPWDPMSYR